MSSTKKADVKDLHLRIKALKEVIKSLMGDIDERKDLPERLLHILGESYNLQGLSKDDRNDFSEQLASLKYSTLGRYHRNIDHVRNHLQK